MAKKTQDLKPDTVLKNYWNDNEQFADLFNAVLFEGRQVIKPDELENEDTEESSVLEHRDYAESIRASRDNIKIHKKSFIHGVQFVLLGLEHQERIHYAMPMRVMGYDYSSYKKQYDSNARKYKTADGMDDDEYLSKMKRTDKFMPVVTIIVYYGEKPYDGATTLQGMLSISDEMKNLVNDYKIRLVEARENKLTLHNMNNRDLFNLLQIVLDNTIPKKEAREKAIQYSREHKIDKSVIMTVAGAANMKLDYNALVEKGVGDMCTLFEEIAKENEIKGKAEGEAKGIIKMLEKYNVSDDNIVKELVSELEISIIAAKEYLNKYRQGIL